MKTETEIARLLPRTEALNLIAIEDGIIAAEPKFTKYQVFWGTAAVWVNLVRL